MKRKEKQRKQQEIQEQQPPRWNGVNASLTDQPEGAAALRLPHLQARDINSAPWNPSEPRSVLSSHKVAGAGAVRESSTAPHRARNASMVERNMGRLPAVGRGGLPLVQPSAQ